MEERRFLYPERVTDQSLAAMMAGEYELRVEAPIEAELIFYDSFDWRLFNKSLALGRSGKEWIVRSLPSGAVLEKLPAGDGKAAGRARRIRQQRTYVASDFAGASAPIAAIAGERRLFAVGEAQTRTKHYRLLNADEKTVAHLTAETLSIEASSPAETGGDQQNVEYNVITLQAVRGYLGHFGQLAAKLEAAGLTALNTERGQWQEVFERITTAAGKRPGSYSAKPDYQLAPGMRADEAARLILRQTLVVMRANEEGIKADWDIEFLHDYRTAVRRTRSALSQIPAVFDAESTATFREAFGMLGERSNRLRDIDVYLSSESAYRAMLPAAMAQHITPLFEALHSQRRQALEEVITYLNSEQYARLMVEWEVFLHRPFSDDMAAPNAALPIDELARRRIWKRYRQVIEDGSQIHDHTEDEIVHALRIDCKKLRYLIEFFASLFPKKEIDRLVGQMKALQDELGLFNDLSVQQAYLMENAALVAGGNAASGYGESGRALVAIGFLVAKLAAEQQTMKPAIVKRFAEFASPPNRALFRQLFKENTVVSTNRIADT